MYLIRRISKYPLEYARSKRKKRYWLLIWFVSAFAVCDVLILFVLFKIFLPMLLNTTPYLLPEHAQEYTHLATFTAPGQHVTTLAFTPDGKTLACAAYNEILLWDVKTGNQLYTVNEFSDYVTALTFSPDGMSFASSSKSNQSPIILCDTVTGQVKSYLSGHTSWIATLNFSPSGDTLIGASPDGMIIAWDTDTGNIQQRILGRFAFARRTTLAFFRRTSPTYSHLESIKGHILTRWNRVFEDTNLVNTSESLVSILKSKMFEDDGIIAITPGPNLLPIYLSSHIYPVQALEFSPDGKTLASSSRSEYQPFDITAGIIHLWDVDTGLSTSTLKTPGRRVDTIAFSSDGKTLASDGSKRWKGSRKILIWDLTTHRLISMIDTDSWGEITVLTFAPDNVTLASGNDRGKVDLWDITSQIRK
ncbi:MAG: hypothetical protein OXI43_17945 [Candidatus Poribacteria bacterium]|nr:hypothetical protein [Candidatus Poribacteria bacterium]